MQTYSHFLLTAVLHKPVAKAVAKAVDAKQIPKLRTSAVLIGSIIPDMLLTIIAIVCGVIDLIRGVPLGFNEEGSGDVPSLMGQLFNDWFFNNPWVIASQQLFHSPLVVGIFIIVAYLLWQRSVKGAGWFFWLSCAAMLHTLIDIPLHYDDGPLLLWPLNWDLRYYSPVSYWDPNHFGVPAAIVEHYLDLVYIIILALGFNGWRWLRIVLWLIVLLVIPTLLLLGLNASGAIELF